jgi:hypothetical protein
VSSRPGTVDEPQTRGTGSNACRPVFLWKTRSICDYVFLTPHQTRTSARTNRGSLDLTFWEHGYFFTKKFLVFGSASLTSFPKGEISLAIEQNCIGSLFYFVFIILFNIRYSTFFLRGFPKHESV